MIGYFQTHLCATAKEAARDLNVSPATASRYVRLIRSEWRNKAISVDLADIELRVVNLEKAMGRLLEPVL